MWDVWEGTLVGVVRVVGDPGKLRGFEECLGIERGTRALFGTREVTLTRKIRARRNPNHNRRPYFQNRKEEDTLRPNSLPCKMFWRAKNVKKAEGDIKTQ